MDICKDAFLLPGLRVNRSVSTFGVFGADGNRLADCEICSTPWTTQGPDTATAPQNAPIVYGPALFAGSVDKQYGFVLLNSLGRLWALDDLPPETVIVYGEKQADRSPGYNFVPMILRSLGITNPVLITQNALRFETLYTAEERFGECLGGKGHPDFYDWIDRKWPATAAPDPDCKVYVTRSGLGANMGRFACEDHLETLLQAEGYQIYRPEAHSFAHQVKTFQTAGKLIFAEGSAVHLFALIRHPDQVSAVIHRRAALPDVMLAQMADRPGKPTIAINAVRAHWWPPRRGAHLGRSELDFDILRDGLAGLGLITGRDWRAPTRAQVDISLSDGLAPGQMLMDSGQRAAWLKQRRQAKRKR